MTRLSPIGLTLGALLLSVLAGCGDGKEQKEDPYANVPRGNVSGKVTINGQPPAMKDLKILFQPPDGRYEALDVNEQGEYSGKAVAGPNKVFVSAPSLAHAGASSPIPEKYMQGETTTHTADVKDGADNKF